MKNKIKKFLEFLKPTEKFIFVRSKYFDQTKLEIYDSNYEPIIHKYNDSIYYCFVNDTDDIDYHISVLIKHIMNIKKIFPNIWKYKFVIYDRNTFEIKQKLYHEKQVMLGQIMLESNN